MSDPERPAACRNCERVRPAGQLDRYRWCRSCRAEVVRRATRVAHLVAFLGAGALAAWIFGFAVGPSPRFLMAWLVLIAAAYFFLVKLVRRVAFEIIRARGVPPAEE